METAETYSVLKDNMNMYTYKLSNRSHVNML